MDEATYTRLKKDLDFLLAENIRLQEQNKCLLARFTLTALRDQPPDTVARQSSDTHVPKESDRPRQAQACRYGSDRNSATLIDTCST